MTSSYTIGSGTQLGERVDVQLERSPLSRQLWVAQLTTQPSPLRAARAGWAVSAAASERRLDPERGVEPFDGAFGEGEAALRDAADDGAFVGSRIVRREIDVRDVRRGRCRRSRPSSTFRRAAATSLRRAGRPQNSVLALIAAPAAERPRSGSRATRLACKPPRSRSRQRRVFDPALEPLIAAWRLPNIARRSGR